MPITAPKLTRQILLAGKVETTTGTAIALSTSDATTVAFNSAIAYEIPAGDRRGQGVSLARIPQQPGAQSGTLEFSSELYGSGSAGVAPSWAKYLLAAGFAQSGTNITYLPASGATNQTTLTVAVNKDGLQKQLAGVSMNWNLELRAGSIPMFRWNGLGKYVAATDTALLAPTYDTVVGPKFQGATITFGGSNFSNVSEVTIACNNQLTLRQAAQDGTGYEAAYVTDRDITVTITDEAVALATQDWFVAHTNRTEYALSIAMGSTTGNTWTITAPKMQLRQSPEDAENNGIYQHRLTFQCNRSAAAGDDELQIAMT